MLSPRIAQATPKWLQAKAKTQAVAIVFDSFTAFLRQALHA
jgi:hypothetical protein